MFKKNFGKILFFIFNIFFLAEGVFFIKDKESKKVIENTNASDSKNIQDKSSAQNSDLIAPSANLPMVEEKTVNNNNTAPDIKSNTISSTTTKKAKTRAS